MRQRFIGSLAILLAGAGAVLPSSSALATPKLFQAGLVAAAAPPKPARFADQVTAQDLEVQDKSDESKEKKPEPELIPPPKVDPSKDAKAPVLPDDAGKLRPHADGFKPADACAPLCCPPCCCCPCRKPRLWATAEYLLWWIDDGPVPLPLVTTSTTAGPPINAGFFSDPGAAVLFGNTSIDYGTLSGGRVSVGYWLTPEQTLGVETSWFLLEQGTFEFAARSNAAGSPVLSRPVIRSDTGAESGFRAAFPGALAGGVLVGSNSQLWGADVNLTGRVFAGSSLTWDLLAGFRYLDLEEDLNVAQSTTILAGGITGFNGVFFREGNGIALYDSFDARTQFWGGQLGSRLTYTLGRVVAESTIKVGLGCNHQTLTVGGSTTLFPIGGGSRTASGGALAQISNIGRYSRDDFAVVPEVTVNVGYNLTDALRVFVGYNFLYISEVVRPGEQISRTVNPTLPPASLEYGPLVGPRAPILTGLQRDDYWAQGLNFGLSFRY
jgi:hypothetical protein